MLRVKIILGQFLLTTYVNNSNTETEQEFFFVNLPFKSRMKITLLDHLMVESLGVMETNQEN